MNNKIIAAGLSSAIVLAISGSAFALHSLNTDKSKIELSNAGFGTPLLNTIAVQEPSELVKINASDIKLDNMYTSVNTLTFTIGDLQGALIDLKLINADSQAERIYTNIEGKKQITNSNLDTGRWLIYVTKIAYLDGTTLSGVSTISPYLLKSVVVTDKDNVETPPEIGEGGAPVINDAIKQPVLRYDSSKSILNQISEIKSIASTVVSLSPYTYSNSDVDGVQFIIIDDNDRVESPVMALTPNEPYKFENLQPNTTYKIGYRVLNSTKYTEDNTKIEGAWSNYTTVEVTTNASKQLAVTKGEYKDNRLELYINSSINKVMPFYKIKILPITVNIRDVLSTPSSVKIKNARGEDATNSFVNTNLLYVDGLTPNGTNADTEYAVYITDVTGTNNFTVTSNPVALKGTDSYIGYITNIKITADMITDKNLAKRILESDISELPSDMKELPKTKIVNVLNEVAVTDRLKAARIYYSEFGSSEVVTQHTASFNMNDYARLTSNIYYNKNGSLKCIKYIEYKQPSKVFELRIN